MGTDAGYPQNPADIRTLKDQAKTLARYPESAALRRVVASNVARVEAERGR